MNKQLLIYEKTVPVSSGRHADWSVMAGDNFMFAQHVNSVPLIAAEFPNAATEYAIVFAGKDEVIPVVVLGIRDHENLYLTKGGSWKAKYVPAFVRRYPFVFSSTADGSKFTLCIDEEYDGCNQEGLGERLFDDEKKGTQYLENVLEFLKQYQEQYRRTQVFCKKLQELDLLEPMQAQVTMNTGQKMTLAGFTAASRKRLKELTPGQLAELAKTNELELIYLHLQSMKNLSTMMGQTAAEQIKDAPAQKTDAIGAQNA